jgi:alkanesulfonate monooxygenase SsuD/methylene tetrahydromethanopterin reductase-like flavin-dependent oxidoreductase (luciferase family)
MNIGVVMWPYSSWPTMGEQWRRAEELGFHTGWIYDHLAWRGHTPWDDAYTSLGAAAAITSMIRLGTLVTSPNFRHPVPTAQAAKTIDRISNGRLTLGIGAGGASPTSDGEILDEVWTPRERADRFAEWVGQLDGLLTTAPFSATGDYWSVREGNIAPGLVQRRPPFWIAGEGPRGMRLAARYGQAWITNPDSPDAPALDLVRTQVAKFEEICAAEGKDPAAFPKMLLTGFTGDRWLDSVEAFHDLKGQYEAIGITDVAVHWPRPDSDWNADPKIFEEIALSLGA